MISISEQTTKQLKKLNNAKIAFGQLIRAIKKKDYMILQSEQVPEVDLIKPIVPEITKYHEDLKQLRANQRSKFMSQLKRSHEDDQLTLPVLHQNVAQRSNYQSGLDQMAMHTFMSPRQTTDELQSTQENELKA